MVDHEVELELVRFWEKNPNKLREVPKKLKSKITQDEAMMLQTPYRVRGGKIEMKGLRELESDILREIDRNGGFWVKTEVRIGIIVGIIAIISYIFKCLGLW